jgi:hypothetical protein
MLLALSSGSIASDLYAISIDRRRKFATYELLVANETISAVAAFAYAVGAAPNSMMSWSTITVPPFASVAVTFDVPLPQDGRKQRVVVELHAEDAHLTLDAEPPKSTGPALPKPAAIALGLAAVGSAGLVATYAFLQPRVLALAAPMTVIAGKPFSAAYVLGGAAGGGDYVIETPQGFQVRRGVLDRRSGSVTVTLPDAGDLRTYDLRVTVQNKLGRDSRIARITALPPPATPPPLPPPAAGSHLLPEVALSSPEVIGGQPVGVSYAAAGASADVFLIDQADKVVGKALLDPSGHTVLVTPPVPVDQPFKVVVKAHEGNSSLESDASLTVKAGRQPEAATGDDQPPAPDAQGIAVEGDLPFALASPVVRSGDLVRIAIVQHQQGLRLALTTLAGSEVAAFEVAVNQDSIAIRAPKVAARSEYLIVATFRRGISQETVVRPISIIP